MVTICRSVLVPAIKGEQKVNKKVNLKDINDVSYRSRVVLRH